MRSFLTPAIVAGVGTFLCILAGVLIFILVIKPSQDDLAAQQARYQKVSTFDQLAVDAAKKDKAKSQAELDASKNKWDYIQTHYNPTIDLTDRFKAWQELVKELEYNLGPDIDNFMTKNKSGAIRLGTAHVMAPPSDPNDVKDAVIKIPITLEPFPAPSSGNGGGGGGGGTSSSGFSGGSSGGGGGGGGVSVIGTFDQDLNQVESWKNFNRIVKVDGVSLTGYSPFIVASYNATIYEFTTNSELIGAPLPTASGATSGASTSAPGGPPGGPPPGGMPPRPGR